MKNSVVFYKEWLDLVNSLQNDKRLKFYDLIFSFDKNNLPKFDDKHLESVFNFISKKIIENNKKYKTKCDKARESANARWNKNNNQTKQKQLDFIDEFSNDEDSQIDTDIKKDFEIFWNNYTPIKCNNRFIKKGSKKIAFEEYKKAINNGATKEEVIFGLKKYIKYCKNNAILTTTAISFFKRESWKDEYEGCVDSKIKSDAEKEREEFEKKLLHDTLITKD